MNCELDKLILSIGSGHNVLALDANSWASHVRNSIGLLLTLKKEKNNCFYLPNDRRIVPSFFNPYFGKSGTVNLDNLNKLGIKIVENIELSPGYIPQHLLDNALNDLLVCTNREELTKIKILDFPVGYAAVSTIASEFGIQGFSKKIIRTYGAILIKKYVKELNIVAQLITKYKIDFLIIFNGRFVAENAAYQIAKKFGCEVIFHDGSRSERYLHIYPLTPHSKSGFKSIHEHMVQTLSKEAIRMLGEDWLLTRLMGKDNEILDFQSNWEQTTSLTKRSRIVISFFPSSDDEFLGISPDWDLPEHKSQFEHMGKIIERLSGENFELHVRLHPNLKNKSSILRQDWNSLKNLPNTKVYEYNSSMSSYELAKRSDLVITCGSTMAIEAGYLGKPVLSIGHGIYDDLEIINSELRIDKIIELVNSKDFQNLVPNREKCIQYAAIFGYMNNELSKEIMNQVLDCVSETKPNLFIKISSKIFRIVRQKYLFIKFDLV